MPKHHAVERRREPTMLKITKIQESGNDVLIKLEGKIAEQWAALLDGECRAYLRQKKAVYLECSHVEYVDARGIEVVNNLPRKQVTLMSAPAFIVELLHVGGRS
jgi:anti-anti-sigma regulatory factor